VRFDAIDLLSGEPEMTAPTHRSAGPWLVVLLAFVSTLAMAVAIELLNRRELAHHLGRPLRGIALQPLREFTTAEAWSELGMFRRSRDMKAAVGRRWPESEVAAYAYWTAALACDSKKDKDERFELCRKAVRVAQPGSRHFAVVYSSLSRWLRQDGRDDEAVATLKQGLERAVSVRGKGRLLSDLTWAVTETRGPAAALEVLREYCEADRALADSAPVLCARARVYEELGNTHEASRLWSRVLAESDPEGYRETAREALARLRSGDGRDDH
jgi:tetratricopeptide (TPR) repeat protein